MTDSPGTPDANVNPRRSFLVAALLLHLLFAGFSAVQTPAFEGPDENDHVYYAYFLHRTGTLPLIKGSATRLDRSVFEEAELGHHPPLYFALAGALLGDTLPSWVPNPEFATGAAARDGQSVTVHKLHGFDEVAPTSNELRRLWATRGLSVLCGLLSLSLIWLLGRRLFPERPSVAGAAAVLVACTPQWAFVHGCVENGNLATTLSLGALLAMTDAVRRRELTAWRGLGIGTLVGLALLTKLTALFLLPLCAATFGLGLAAWPERRRTLISGVVALLTIAAIAGWYFWRNWTLYGDPLALDVHASAFASNQLAQIAEDTGRPLETVRSEYLRRDFPVQTARSAIAGFGWAAVGAPVAEWLALLVAAAGLLGWAIRPHRLLRGRVLAVALQGLAAALVLFGLVRFNMTFVQPQGRYLLPAYGPVAILIAAGLAVLLAEGERSRLRLRWLGVVPPLLCGGVLAFIARPALDPSDARTEDPEFASLHGGVRHEPESPEIELLAPAADELVTGPPTFRWRCEGAPANAHYTIHFELPSGLILGIVETARIPIEGESFTPLAVWWDAFPHGEQPLRWRVRRLPNREAGENVADVEQSEFRVIRRK